MSARDLSIGLVTLNARFVHVALSLRYLRNAARAGGFDNVWIGEYTIDQPVWKIAADIQRHQPDVVGLSIYIWNRIQSFQLVELLQKQNPSIFVVVGGPEVSFEPEISTSYTVIGGEGEDKWVECLQHIWRSETPKKEVLERWKIYGNDLPELVPPYIEEDYSGLENRMAYIETSRGCPYLCSFCLSALDKTVRYFDNGLIQWQIERLVASGVKTIKFIDRTFNIQGKRMLDWMHWLTRFERISFHFEVVGDRLSEEALGFLDTVPPGMFQFEIGVQTTGEEGQATVKRKQNNGRLFKSIRRLERQNRVHLHCDLIFGLPGETLEDCLQSFTEVLELKPQELQLGFLKFLPGAPVRKMIKPNQYRFQSYPPYELIAHKDLSAESVIYLKKFTEVFNRFYNSKRFRFTIDHLLKTWKSFDLFDHLLKYTEENNLLNRSLSLENQYRVFYDAFRIEHDALAVDFLRLDYVYRHQVYRLPPFLQKFPLGPGGKKKTWCGDKKSPLFSFRHTIEMNAGNPVLKPSSEPVYYAFIHEKDRNGYLTAPSVVSERRTGNSAT